MPVKLKTASMHPCLLQGSDTAEPGLPGQAIQVHLGGELAEVGCLGRRIHVSGIVRPGHGGAAGGRVVWVGRWASKGWGLD